MRQEDSLFRTKFNERIGNLRQFFNLNLFIIEVSNMHLKRILMITQTKRVHATFIDRQ